MMKHIHRKTRRSPEEIARLHADRERYQRDKPAPEQLLAEGGHQDFVSLGELILIHGLMASLKKERERQGLTLAELSDRTGIDQAALSRLETGKNANPTVQTLFSIAIALDKLIVCGLQDAPPHEASQGKRVAHA
jgi:DNA-binding Xre family transcriptional regulator